MLVEDAVYSVVSSKKSNRCIPELLLCQEAKTDHNAVAGLITELRPRCKLQADCVDAVFQPHVERCKTLFLHPRPVHYAVINNSARLTRMLLALASHVDINERTVEKDGTSPSLMFLATLFADNRVVEVLKAFCVTCNPCDQNAALKLKRAGHWQQFKARMEDLGLQEVALHLDSQLNDQEEQLAKIRQAAREKAAAAVARNAAARATASMVQACPAHL
jgi:hypothetical protein